MQIAIEVENIKCGGCANSITRKLLENSDFQNVSVDVEKGIVTLESANAEAHSGAVASLLKMGYPETGSVEGLKSVKAKASSFVSCAVGRMNQND
jgi:copper chaperone